MGASLKSLRRFVTFVLRIAEPSAYFHQTLTFSPQERDYSMAKAKLEKLLDNIHHRFVDAASFYVGELQTSGGYHFHVLFLFFGSVPSTLEKSLRKAVWQAWNGMQDGRLARQANRLIERSAYFKDREKTIRYFAGDWYDAPQRWWGCRNRALIRVHSSPVDQSVLKTILTLLKPSVAVNFQPEVKKGNEHIFTYRDLKSMRDSVEFHQRYEWEDFKRMKTGSASKVTDAQFIDFINGMDNKPAAFP